jgi:hypothetical protein
LAEPPENRVRFDPGLAATVTQRHLNHTPSDDFCGRLWQISKWIASPIEDYGFIYSSKLRTNAGGDGFWYKSLLFPGVITRLTDEPDGRSRRVSAETINWTVERTGRGGVSTQTANLMLNSTGSETALHVFR